jgi:protease-4
MLARMRSTVLFFALSAFCAAHAQSPSRGIRLPFPAVGLGDDASGVEVNPGGLGLLRGTDVQLVGTSLSEGVGGSGVALFAARPLLVPGLAVGLGAQLVSTQTYGALRFDDYTRLSFSTAYAPTEWLSAGLTLHTQFGNTPGVGGITGLDLGILFRPTSWLSVGLLAQDLNTPNFNGVPLNRAWILGAAFRPGTDRVLLAGEVRIEESVAPGQPSQVDPTFRALFEPVPGLLLGGSVELRDRAGRTEVTGQLGLTWSFDLAPLRGSLGYSSFVERGRGHDGFSVQARFRAARERALPEPRERWVKLLLQGGIPEQEPPRRGVLAPAAPRWTMGRVVGALRAALRDERVTGVLLAFDGVGIGLGQAQEIRALLLELRRAQKRVVAHVRGASNGVYLAASGAERIYLDPTTTVNLVGLSGSVLFLRGLLDKIGVLPEFVAEGKYKSLPEKYTRKSMSEPAKEALLHVLRDAQGWLTRAVAQARRKSEAEVRALIDRAPLGPEGAVQAGLADGVAYLDDLPRRLEKEGIRVRLLGDVGACPGARWGGRPRIAVVHVEGTIAEGKSFVDPFFGSRVAGAETITRALREARGDPRVRAVILRVSSGGGSATASDRIWREVVRTGKVKLVLASFGNVAASGGYYVAAGAREIFADPTTLTGSIGILFGKFSLAGLFGKLDLARETHKLGKHADLLSDARPWTEEERRHVRSLLLESYEQFLDRVVRGRKMTRDQVHRVAQGRIWTGAQAAGHKLVDHLGGLDDALRRAEALSGLAPGEAIVDHLPRPGLIQRFLRDVLDVRAEAAGRVARAALRRVSSPLLYLRAGEPWAILPYQIDLR